MKISVIIPVSRVVDAKECLLSLENQDFPKSDFEVAVVSAGDISALAEMSVSFKLHCIEARRNHPSFLRNLGVSKTRGNILGFVDDDTVLPPHWLATVHRILAEYPERIIGGPNVDRRRQFSYALANAVQEHPLLEGLGNHRSMSVECQPIGSHNLPFSNVAMARDIFVRIGGFNEVANYYMDGSEFLYIATRLEIPIYLYRELEIQHNLRPAFLSYFLYKWRARRMLGGNYVLFPECYRNAKPIKLIFASFVFLPLFAVLLSSSPNPLTVLGGVFAAYLILLYVLGFRFFGRPLIFAALGPSVFIAQVCSYLGFTYGLLRGFFTVRGSQGVIKHKQDRYRVFEDQSI